MKTKTYFFKEDTKKKHIIKALKTTNNTILEYIDTITKMKIGNKIGYFQFMIDNTYFKFYIMPKIYDIKEGECFNNCDQYKKNFISFFKIYYKLNAKYNIQKYSNELEGNISDLTFNKREGAKNFEYTVITQIDDFIVHNYKDSLLILKSFFTKHKHQTYIKESFQSQSIKHPLNLKKNLLNPDNCNIHQMKKTPISNSILVTITITILNHFLMKKMKNYSNTEQVIKLKKEITKLQLLLKKRFKYDKHSFKVKELLSHKISKLFEKNNEYKLVYKALLKLAGKEHYYNGDIYQELKKEDETIALFFQPEKLYEWIVYDKLIEMNSFDEVLKDDKDNILKKYKLEPIDREFSSKPDIIVKKGNALYPIDAKWKILKIKDASFDNDVFKLRRDSKIRNSNKGYLAYPKIDKDSDFKIDTEYKYDFDNSFKLEILEVTT